jgi:hypothetical protein
VEPGQSLYRSGGAGAPEEADGMGRERIEALERGEEGGSAAEGGVSCVVPRRSPHRPRKEAGQGASRRFARVEERMAAAPRATGQAGAGAERLGECLVKGGGTFQHGSLRIYSFQHYPPRSLPPLPLGNPALAWRARMAVAFGPAREREEAP